MKVLSKNSIEILGLIAGGRCCLKLVGEEVEIDSQDIINAAKEVLLVCQESALDFQQRMSKIKSNHPKAYTPWSNEDDAKLIELHGQGLCINELATHFQRKPSAIRSRLNKNGINYKKMSAKA